MYLYIKIAIYLFVLVQKLRIKKYLTPVTLNQFTEKQQQYMVPFHF